MAEPTIREGSIAKLEPGPTGSVKATIAVTYNIFEGYTYSDGAPFCPSLETEYLTLFLSREALAGLYPGDAVTVTLAIAAAEPSDG